MNEYALFMHIMWMSSGCLTGACTLVGWPLSAF